MTERVTKAEGGAGPRLLGAVLAGGRSRRYGRPKHAEAVRGRTMLQRALDVLDERGLDTVIVSSRPVEGAGNTPVVPDRVAERGPLGGLHAALHEAHERGLEGVFLLACDLPLVDSAVAGVLLSAAEGEPAPIWAPARAGGHVEPLCAVYSLEVLPAVESRLASDDRSLHALFREVGGRSLELGGRPFLNVNTPADRDRAEAALGTGEGGGMPPVVCVVGKKKSGKTTTTVGLVAELVARGYRVMTAKHGHGFELDTEGTDSWRHRREGGAARVVMAGPDQVAVMGMWPLEEEPLETLVERFLFDADIVVAEGFKRSSFPRVEVYRRTAHEKPLYGGDPNVDRRYVAILTDVPDFEAHVPVHDVDDPERFRWLADRVEEALLGG